MIAIRQINALLKDDILLKSESFSLSGRIANKKSNYEKHPLPFGRGCGFI